MKSLISRVLAGHNFSAVNVFGMDIRSLAMIRISAASILLWDLVTRSIDLRVFYGDMGVVPSTLQHSFSSGAWAWSIHLWDGGSLTLLVVLFLIHGIATGALLLGYKTRVAAVSTWILAVSLQNANPLILLGGDFLLRGVLFVGMFLPWGEAYSLDRLFSRENSVRKKIVSTWTAAFLTQLAFMYYFASFFKSSVRWTEEGSAVYYTLSIDQYATALAKYLLHFPQLLVFLTFAIVIFQHAAIFLLFSPVWTRYIRNLTAFGLMFMHLSFALCMHLGMFSVVAITALVGFITTDVWDGAAEWLRSKKQRSFQKAGEFLTIPETREGPDPPKAQSGQGVAKRVATSIISILGICFILYQFLWQAGDFVVFRKYVPVWDGWSIPVKMLRIDQRWNLFAPNPYRDDGWDIAAGTLKNGQEIDLFRGGTPLSFERPETIFSIYPSVRWRQYLLELRKSHSAKYRPYYADYLCRAWNGTHEGAEQLSSVEVIFMLEETAPPGHPGYPVERKPLITWKCDSRPGA